jgi:hypothetical protein
MPTPAVLKVSSIFMSLISGGAENYSFFFHTECISVVDTYPAAPDPKLNLNLKKNHQNISYLIITKLKNTII